MFPFIYLYEQGIVCNLYLYKALPTMSAPRTVIVQTLSAEDIAYIWSADIDMLSPWDWDYAIVCIGIDHGFPVPSDIVSLRFENIDWKRRSICLTQEKTGKISHCRCQWKPETFCSDIFVMADRKVPTYMYLSSTKYLSKGFIAAYAQKALNRFRLTRMLVAMVFMYSGEHLQQTC